MKIPTPTLILILSMFSQAAMATAESSSRDAVFVRYNLGVDEKEVLSISVYNPNEFSVCSSYSSWPGGGDALTVFGRSGQQWNYIGLEAYTVGQAKEMKIAAHTTADTTIDLRSNYEPVTPGDHLGKVYFGSLFFRCE